MKVDGLKMPKVTFFSGIMLSTFLAACTFDSGGLSSSVLGDLAVQEASGRDLSPDALSPDTLSPDALSPDTLSPDALSPDTLSPDTLSPDTLSPDTRPPCVGGTSDCLADGTKRLCQQGAWVAQGVCPLGCDGAQRRCIVPSNIPEALTNQGTGVLHVDSSLSPLHIDTATGHIFTQRGGHVDEFRPIKLGLDTKTQIFFEQVPQPGGAPPLGVLVLKSFAMDASTELVVEGSSPLAIYVSATADIGGTLSLNAKGLEPGPGGYAGGKPNQPGGGSCGGQPGTGKKYYSCASGSGGGGHGGTGGSGGDASCSSTLTGGAGGGICGDDRLIPLTGGSGGAGGVSWDSTISSTSPGGGGGGGGALQISARGSITLRTTGRIQAGGGGGGKCKSGGGAGGGAGGGVLLESPIITLEGGSVIAANGGGGSGGDNKT